jgi:hypothetical protein
LRSGANNREFARAYQGIRRRKTGPSGQSHGHNAMCVSYLLGDAIAAGRLLAPAKTLGEMSRIVFNDYVDASLAAVFVLVVVATVIYGLINIWRALGNPQPTASEIGLAGVAAGGGHA